MRNFRTSIGNYGDISLINHANFIIEFLAIWKVNFERLNICHIILRTMEKTLLHNTVSMHATMTVSFHNNCLYLIAPTFSSHPSGRHSLYFLCSWLDWLEIFDFEKNAKIIFTLPPFTKATIEVRKDSAFLAAASFQWPIPGPAFSAHLIFERHRLPCISHFWPTLKNLSSRTPGKHSYNTAQ